MLPGLARDWRAPQRSPAALGSLGRDRESIPGASTVQNEIVEIRLGAERLAGELLAKREQVKLHRVTSPRGGGTSKPLPDGISKTESSRWQAIASVPEEEFVAHVEGTKAKAKELTTNWRPHL